MAEGRVIAGRYRLDREIGRGGMGAVWRGVDTVLGRDVALKQLTPVHAGGPTAARAAREAQLAARLSHQHVVAAYDLVVEDGHPWLVMEYVDGTTLAGLVAQNGPLRPEGAANILAKVASALLAAHQAGVVHRDVKPSNILLSPQGQVKLADFGIARATDADHTLTQTGLVTGSPAYLSPEVASGQSATPASDVWSLGATLYFALTGRPPYEVGDNVLGTLYRIVNDEPPRTDRAGRLGPVLAGAMTRDTNRRWSMDRVHRALLNEPADGGPTQTMAAPTRAAGPVEIAPEPDRTSRRRRAPWVLAALLAVVVIAGLLLWLGTRSDPDDTAAAGHRPTHTTSASPSPSSPSPSPSKTPTHRGPEPTAAGVRSFVSDYLDAAASDPRQAYEMLTPAYQSASGGYAGYSSFWNGVQHITSVDSVEPELGDNLGVSYRYTYVYKHKGTVTEDVHLHLVFDRGRYLIDGD